MDTEGPYRGMGQLGEPAVKDAVSKINELYQKASNIISQMPDGPEKEEARQKLESNYLVKNIANQDGQTLWQKCSTDPKLCAALAASSLVDINDRRFTLFGENPQIVIMSYNAGLTKVGDVYLAKGLVELSSDKKELTIYLDKGYKEFCNDSDALKKWNEAVTYIIGCLGGAEALKECNGYQVAETLENHRQKVGPNMNQEGYDLRQFIDYAPDGVTYKGVQELENLLGHER